MKKKGPVFAMLLCLAVVLTGCEPSLAVLDPKGPVAKIQSDTIIFSILMMAGVLAVVYALYIYMLTKYRAAKADPDYEPPHMDGNKWMELTWTLIPVLIVLILSVVTVRTTNQVEAVPKGYENQHPLVIYASSSNWKWHFSYPEEGIETVNYVNIPTNRAVEFRLYSHGPISSFWIPQLGGQKYAMSNMVTKLHLAAEQPGSFMGKNANFNGKGFAQMEFETWAMPPAEYTKWVHEAKSTAPGLTKQEFDKIVNTPYVGRMTYSSTHLAFSPAPEGVQAGHHHADERPSSPDPSTEMDHMHHSST